jgi:hypothetical protein
MMTRREGPADVRSLASRCAEIAAAVEALRNGRPVPGGVAVALADCLESLLTREKFDLAARLGVRLRHGGAYDVPARLQEYQQRDALIRRLFDAVKSSDKTRRAEHVAAIIRGEDVVPEEAAKVAEELVRFENLPRSGRQIARIIAGESGRHLKISPSSMTDKISSLSLKNPRVP